MVRMWVQMKRLREISMSGRKSDAIIECHQVECAFTSPVRTECGIFVMYCMQCCMSVSAVLCINGRRCVCCGVC